MREECVISDDCIRSNHQFEKDDPKSKFAEEPDWAFRSIDVECAMVDRFRELERTRHHSID